ncbi:INP53 [Symbiodinium natans]|uniref:INP53 protein n=1 Tax=Symbiodinium natans TaxID=878477 RepID=A0A812IDU2_9DINO|nr:INP53 [Symbiodinium natans]
MQQVNMLASIPVVVSSRLRNMAIAPSARCTCIYIWSSWLALIVVDEFTRWLLLCVSFAAYAVAALEQLVQVSILRTTKENAEWAPLLLFQVVLAGIYGVIYLGAVLNCYSWRTEQLLYSFADVSAKFLHSCFTMSLRRKNKLQQLSLLRQAAVNAATDLQCMIRQANVPIFVVNMQLEVEDWNLKTAQVTGLSG